MRNANWIAGLLLLALAGYVIVASRGFPDPPDNSPGPGMFPIIVAGALILLVLAMLWENRREQDREPVVDLESPHFRRALLVGGVLTIYALILPLVGFLVATPLGLFGTMLAVGREHLLIKGVTTVLTTGLLYVVFQTVLQVPLP